MRVTASVEPDNFSMLVTAFGSFEEIAERLEQRFQADTGREWAGAEFEELALAAFALQFAHVEPYRALCERRRRTPESVEHWRDVPAVPATAFKHFDFLVGGSAETVFRTSGTTRGQARRGRHLVRRLSLYRRALIGPFSAHVLADGGPLRFLSLIPSPEALPDSSLSFMVGAAAEELATEIHWLVSGGGDVDEPTLRAEAERASDANEAVLLLGTALSLFHLVERLQKEPGTLLPSGSVIMETGGFKGRRRSTSREELYHRLAEAVGVPVERIVSEYGMTELLSQLYDPVLSEGPAATGVYAPPPWLKVRALDPLTLEELPDGTEGVLCFFDLANVGSVCHVLTEDVGSVVDGRVRLVGRTPGSEPRGCSLAMDEIMSAARARSSA